MKKRYLAILLITVLLGATGCGEKEPKQEETAPAEQEEFSYDPVLYEDLKSTVVSLGDYKGLEGTRTQAEVTDEEVEAEIENIKRGYAELETVDRAAEEGDVVLIDYTGYVDGETSDSLQGKEFSLELGSGMFVPGFEEQLLGASAEESREVNLTFPEDYHKEMAGKDARFEVYVHEVQAYSLPEWNDDFIRENLEYDGEEDMRASIRSGMEEEASKDADANLEYDLISAFLEGSEFDLKDEDVEAYIDEMMSEYESYAAASGVDLDTFLQTYFQMNAAQMRELFKETAAFRVRMTLAFHQIAEEEGLEVSEEEYQARVQELADQYQYEDAAAVEAVYSRAMIEEQMIQEKAIGVIVENAVIS